jgi:guanylate kinase
MKVNDSKTQTQKLPGLALLERSKLSSAPKEGERVSVSPLLLVISAPSGGGKTTLCQQLLRTRSEMTRAITCTTRAPRADEKDGVDYYFLDAATFLKRVQAGHFLEHATVYGNSYGTLRSEVLDKLRSGRDVLLNIDVQGAASVRECVEHDEDLKRAFVSIFLTPPSLEILETRLKKRGQDSPSVIQKRLSVARQEISQWKNFDYLIISTTIGEDLRRMVAIVEAERMRQCRAKAPEF